MASQVDIRGALVVGEGSDQQKEQGAFQIDRRLSKAT
jgi:hypothetical protein